MHILSRVCAVFHDAKGETLFTLTPAMLNRTDIEAPESIQQDPLFDMLLREGSMEIIITAERRRALEKDPMAGYDVTGKAIRPNPAESQEDPSADSASPDAASTAAGSGRSAKSARARTKAPKELIPEITAEIVNGTAEPVYVPESLQV